MSDLVELLQSPQIREQYAKLPERDRLAFEWRARWLMTAHKHQLEPAGDWWSIWLMCAGRGAGKTRAAAENLGWWAWEHPATRWLVSAPTSADLRGTCYEGESGLLSVIPPKLVEKYNSSLHELTLINGSLIKGIPASEPERFRGPQFHGGWCFVAGTQISLADGTTKPIEQIIVGDKVMTRNGARRVTAASLSGNPAALVKIDCGLTSLTGTEDHPIRVGSTWIPMGDLHKGDQVWVTGTPPFVVENVPLLITAEILSVEHLPNQPTYNLTVEDEHEYIANGIIVHNCDELAAWEYLQESWDMIQFGIRLGQHTKLIASTTPKPKDVVMDLIARDGNDVVVTKASTYSNIKNLAPSFQKQIMQYEGTKLGRQEIYAEIIDPEEGGIVQRDWFKLWPAGRPLPKFEYIIQSLDCATSEKTVNDPTAHITLGVFKPEDGGMCALVIDCWQEHMQYPDLRPKVLDEYEVVYGEGKNKKRVDLLLVEDKSAGISLIQDLRRAGVPVMPYNPGRADKVQRLSIVANVIKAGRVWIPESSNRKGFVRDWAEGMVSQICSFPEGTAHDDFVDAMSQALRYLRDAGWLTIDFPKEWIDEDDYVDAGTRKRENPYAV